LGEEGGGRRKKDALPQLLNRPSIPHDLDDNLPSVPLLNPLVQFSQSRGDGVDRVGRLPVVRDEEDLLFGKDDCEEENLKYGSGNAKVGKENALQSL
jgi:hypothetical protein